MAFDYRDQCLPNDRSLVDKLSILVDSLHYVIGFLLLFRSNGLVNVDSDLISRQSVTLNTADGAGLTFFDLKSVWPRGVRAFQQRSRMHSLMFKSYWSPSTSNNLAFTNKFKTGLS